MSLSTIINTAWRTVRKTFSHVLEVIFPEQCIGCARKDTLFCDSCLAKCKKAAPLPESYAEACFSYKDPIVKKAVAYLKFRKQHHIVEKLSPPLEDLVLGICSESLNKELLLVPIPSNHTRTKNRGFDQTYKIAQTVAKHTGLSCLYALERVGGSVAQSTLSRAKRLENMRGAFAVKTTENVVGKTIILIDDVITTGSTVREARNTLLRAGAKNVYAIALAH